MVLADLLGVALGACVVLLGGLGQLRRTLVGLEVDAAGHDLVAGQQLGVAAQDDVHASAGHVGGHGHRAEPARLGDHLGLTEVLLRVQDLVLHPALVQQPAQEL